MRRRGSIYLVVLATVTVVALLGTAGVLAQTRQRARAGAAVESARAAALARSAVEVGLARIMEDPDWRTTPGGGTWYDAAAPTGDPRDGTFSLTVTGPDGGALGSKEDDPFELVGVGTHGSATRAATVSFEGIATIAPLDCLEVGALAADAINLGFNAAVTGTETLASKTDVIAGTALVHVPVDAEGTASGSIYYAGSTSGVGARTLPTASTLQSLYTAGATFIAKNRLRSGSGISLSNTVLAPGYNPWVETDLNSNGVYYINCTNTDVIIENFRMHGTLILINPGPNSVVRGSNSFAPAVEGYPSLIVVGTRSFAFEMSATALSETVTGVNYNPAGAANELGEEDADTSDTYPSAFEGIVHIEGDITIRTGATVTVHGHLFTESTLDMAVGSFLGLNPWSEATSSPPPGYRGEGTTTFVMSPWARDLD